MEIVLLRHGESEANVAGRWQGQGDTPLSPAGRRQAELVAERLAGWRFDRVISSDLGRARATAAALGRPAEVDSRWREIDIGAWEGLTRQQVAEGFPEEIEALREGRDLPLGGGETLAGFRSRVEEAFRALVEELDEGERALVVTHGGVVASVAGAVLGLEDRRVLGRLTNTSLTMVSGPPDRLQLGFYNDAGHLGALTGWAAERLAAGDTVVSLIRHGESEANLAGRWQGLADGSLSETGARQVRALSGWYGGLDALYASRLRRASQTAGVLAGAALAVEEHPDLHEIGLGEWEDRTVEEIRQGWRELWQRIYEKGEDLPRGGSGESYAQVVERMGAALAELAERHAGVRVGVVSHGGAIRAFVGDLLGLDHRSRGRLAMPRNASVSHVVVGEEGLVVADFNVGPHLDR